jgi:hypothetical protein
VSYIVRGFWGRLLVSIAVVCAINAALLPFIYKKRNKTAAARAEDEKIRGVLFDLQFLSPRETFTLFAFALRKLFSAKIRGNKILFLKDNKIVNAFIGSSLTESLREAEQNAVLLLIGDFSSKDRELAAELNLEVIFMDYKVAVREFLLKAGLLPKQVAPRKEKQRKTFKEFFRFATRRENTKQYFFLAFIVLFTSFLTKMPIFYISISSLLFIFAIISRFSKVENDKLF